MNAGDEGGSAGDASGHHHDPAARLRDQAGRQRDMAAVTRDEAGRQRDDDADRRDRLADRRGPEPVGHLSTAGEVRDVGDSTMSAAEAAAVDRQRAQQDRAAGAGDRVKAADDRISALADRTASARDRHHASLDSLTGVYTREAGLLELERDLARARRTGHHLVVAFVDVDHLKEANDAYGHAAGDQMLVAVANTLTAALRPYDLILRYGGDEFLCAVQGIDAIAAGPRFARVNQLLGRTPGNASVTVGLAQLQPQDTSHQLIARADADLYQQRQLR